jgi:hypothetical protein
MRSSYGCHGFIFGFAYVERGEVQLTSRYTPHWMDLRWERDSVLSGPRAAANVLHHPVSRFGTRLLECEFRSVPMAPN